MFISINKEKSPETYQGPFLYMEHPGGLEPPVNELQSLALPLGYGCSVMYFNILSFFNQQRRSFLLYIFSIKRYLRINLHIAAG